MLAGPRDRFIETCTRNGCEALDAEKTSQISRRIWLVQQFGIIEHDGGKLRKRNIRDRPTRILAGWLPKWKDVQHSSLLPDELAARFPCGVKITQMKIDPLADSSTRAQPAMSTSKSLSKDIRAQRTFSLDNGFNHTS